jgi:hypothetical protein
MEMVRRDPLPLLVLLVVLFAGCSAADMPSSDMSMDMGSSGAGGDGTSATTGGGTSAGTSESGGSGGSSAGTDVTASAGSSGSGGTSSPVDAGTSPISEGGASADGAGSQGGWVSIFNGKDLTGWYPMITGYPYKTDPYNTFRADPTTGVIRVTYESYPNGGSFDNHFGLLYYDRALTNYRVRVEYRFLEPQAKNPPSWGKNNSGLMLFCLDPTKVTGDPDFPPLIEIQLLGTPSAGGTNNANICRPGGMTVTTLFDKPAPGGNCADSTTGPAPVAAQWVTVEADVHVNSDTRIYQYPDTTKPVLVFNGVMYGGKPVTTGYVSLQSESQPVEFRKVELMELPE